MAWMAWTWPTAAFFIFIACCLGTMTMLELRNPGGAPRDGIVTRAFAGVIDEVRLHVVQNDPHLPLFEQKGPVLSALHELDRSHVAVALGAFAVIGAQAR